MTHTVDCKNCGKSVENRVAAKLYDSRAAEYPGPVYFCSIKCRNDHLIEVAGEKPTPKKASKLTASQIRAKLRPKETDISRAIGGELTGRGIWNTRTPSGKIKTTNGHLMNLCKNGTPDRLFAAGLHVWIEVKRPGETSTPNQVAAQKELKENGALVFVLDDPGDVRTVIAWLKQMPNRIDRIKAEIAIIQHTIDAAIADARAKRAK